MHKGWNVSHILNFSLTAHISNSFLLITFYPDKPCKEMKNKPKKL